jgi:Ca2+-binding RTX toxin-like protein
MRCPDGSVSPILSLELLEMRRMLTTASVSSSHVLNIFGTKLNETIFVNRLSNGKVSITGIATQFKPGSGSGQFNKILIDAGNGDDKVTISSNVPYSSATILGGGGKDKLVGGKGNDLVSGGEENDTVDGGGGGGDSLVGGPDFDTANYSHRTDDLTISLDNNANDGGNKGAEHDNVQTEEVICGAGDDTVTGSSGDDFIAGGAGDDVLKGMGGNDDLIGSTGTDQLYGANGDDFLQAKNQDRDTVSGGTNSDGSADFDLASVDSIDTAGTTRAAAATATSGNEGTVSGVERFLTDDEVSGASSLLPFATRLAKRSDWAQLYVHSQPTSEGVVTINRSAATVDTTVTFSNVNVNGTPLLAVDINGVQLYYDPATTTQFNIFLGPGNDQVIASDRVRVPLEIHCGAGNDTVTGGARQDTIFGDGGTDSLSGGAKSDILVGGDGNDTAFGNDGRDILIGGNGKDNLYGERGEDILIGGSTSFDADPFLLGSLLAEWTTPTPQKVRIEHLTSGGGLNGDTILTSDTTVGQTLFQDKGDNFLNGGSDRDWFFKQSTDRTMHGGGEEIEKL